MIPPLRPLGHALVLALRDLPGRWRRGPSLPVGLDLVVGEQGCGKTLWVQSRIRHLIATVGLDRFRIASNYDVGLPTIPCRSPHDLVSIVTADLEPGEPRPLLVLIDEIATWWDCVSWTKIGPEIVGLIAQQRKRRLNIIGTVQRFSRLALVIREQARAIWCPRLYVGTRLLRAHRYPSSLYARWYDSTGGWGEPPDTMPILETTWTVATDELRHSYDSWQVIQTLLDTERRAPKGGRRRAATPAAASVS